MEPDIFYFRKPLKPRLTSRGPGALDGTQLKDRCLNSWLCTITPATRPTTEALPDLVPERSTSIHWRDCRSDYAFLLL